MSGLGLAVVDGITCKVTPHTFPDGRTRALYTFTCPGWDECTVTGLRAAKRVIRGRTDPAVLATLRLRPAKASTGQAAPRMCNIFNCDKRHGSYCCADCPQRDKCRNPCLNSPERCGQVMAGRGPA